MDVSEIRSAMLLSEGMADRLRRFRDDRMRMIVSGEAEPALKSNAVVICHLLPLADASIKFPFERSAIHTMRSSLPPLGFSGGMQRYNIDGIMFKSEAKEACLAYCQLFRNGAIETVNAQLLVLKSPLLYASGIEEHILKAVGNYLPALEALGVPFPLIFTCTFIGVKGYGIYTGYEMTELDKPLIGRNQITLPDVLIESPTVNLQSVLRPVFDTLWQAGGYGASPNYDQSTGAWRRLN